MIGMISFDDCGDEIALAEEVGDEGRCRPLVELRRLTELDQPAAAQDGDSVGHRQRLFLIVRDIDKRLAEPLMQELQFPLQLRSQLLVERAQRLIQEQKVRREDQRPSEGDALLLTTGQLLWRALGKLSQLDEIQRAADAIFDF